MEAYLFGGPSFPAVGGFLRRGHYTVNHRGSRNALNVTHFGILFGSELSCIRVQGSKGQPLRYSERFQGHEIWNCTWVGVGLRKGDMSVKEGRINTGPQETTWAFISKLSEVTAMRPESNKPCKRGGVHGFGILLMVEIVRLGKLIASSSSMSTE